MSPQIDISAWPNIDQVAAVTGISRRTLERELADGKWRIRKRKRASGRPETVFDPDQVGARTPAAHTSVVPADAVPARDSANTASVAEMAEIPGEGAHLLQLMVGAFQQVMQGAAAAPVERTLFLALEEASERSGLSPELLAKLARAGKMRFLMDLNSHRNNYSAMKIFTADLEKLEP